MKTLARITLLASVCLIPPAAHAQAPEFPAAARSCITCHGRDGIGTSPGFRPISADFFYGS